MPQLMTQPTIAAHTSDPAVDPTSSGVSDARQGGFAARLREATKSVHREAERSGFIADLIRGRARPHGYATYLRNLVPVYERLEAGLGSLQRPGPLLAAFADPALRRLPALIADLESIAGSNWARTCPLLPEAEAYARVVADADEARLAAHAYARYLGDLSGGQILRPLLARSLGLGPGQLALYDFPGVADVEMSKRAIREALDTVPQEGPTADVIIVAAIAAFGHNIALSTALSDRLRAIPSEA